MEESQRSLMSRHKQSVYDMIPDEPSTVSYVCVAGVSGRTRPRPTAANATAGGTRNIGATPMVSPVRPMSTGGGGY